MIQIHAKKRERGKERIDKGRKEADVERREEREKGSKRGREGRREEEM